MANVKIVESRLNPSKARRRKGSALIDAGGTGGTISTRRNGKRKMSSDSRSNDV